MRVEKRAYSKGNEAAIVGSKKGLFRSDSEQATVVKG
jgi:hypothetical protein